MSKLSYEFGSIQLDLLESFFFQLSLLCSPSYFHRGEHTSYLTQMISLMMDD